MECAHIAVEQDSAMFGVWGAGSVGSHASALGAREAALDATDAFALRSVFRVLTAGRPHLTRPMLVAARGHDYGLFAGDTVSWGHMDMEVFARFRNLALTVQCVPRARVRWMRSAGLSI